ncbi:MAG: metal-dependent hydrolase [Sphingomonadales bacterium]|nr:MAG: metal-dependent hydrolase [Sphingomonadales bacterium]
MVNPKTPADLRITPRDRRFGRGAAQDRWWMAGDPVATAFHNALSITFPKGEAFFIESVKAFRDGASPRLAEEIKAFTLQEVMHSREHVAFNKRVIDAGYDLAPLEQVVDDMLVLIKQRPAIVNLAATMALEHYTAILASMILKDPRYFAGVDAEQADMWRWHAIEELEHKGVAYDTWLHATKDWSKWRRWKLKSLMMLLVTINFWKKRVDGAVELLRQDGLEKGARRRVWLYLLFTPGLLRRIFPAWVAYFLPGFHPWNHDDRHLIGRAESAYAMAPA